MTRLEERVAKIRNLLQPIAFLLDPDTVHLMSEVDDSRTALVLVTAELDAMLTDDCCPKHGIEKKRCGCD